MNCVCDMVLAHGGERGGQGLFWGMAMFNTLQDIDSFSNWCW